MSPNSQPFVHYFLFREGNTTSILKENESLFITEEEGSLVLSFSHVGLHSVSGGGDFSLLKDVSGGKLLGSFWRTKLLNPCIYMVAVETAR